MIISRSEWGAKRGPGPHIAVPVSLLHVHHTVTGLDIGPDAPVSTEKAHMRFLEEVRGFSIGVPYSFGIFRSGRIYEGQGWARKGAHTCNNDLSQCWNDTSHGFAFIGNFSAQKLTDAQVESFRWLTAKGKELGAHTQGVVIRPHRAVKATACPGEDTIRRFEELKGGDDDVGLDDTITGYNWARDNPGKDAPDGKGAHWNFGFRLRRQDEKGVAEPAAGAPGPLPAHKHGLEGMTGPAV